MVNAAQNFFKKIINTFFIFLQTQILVTLIALPVLVSWGLGISYMSFVGNLLFAPFLSFFLLASSLVFFTELSGVSNSFLISALEQSSNIWQFLLQFGSKSWIIYIAKPPLWTLFLIPIITFWIMLTPKIRSGKKRLLYSFGFLIIVVMMFFLWTAFVKRTSGEYHFNNKLIVKNSDNGITAIDYGSLNRKRSVEKLVEFELKPFLISAFGTPIINNFVLQKPGSGSFAVAAALCSNKMVKNITLPFFKPFKSKLAWAQFFILQKAAQQNGVVIERVSFKKTRL